MAPSWQRLQPNVDGDFVLTFGHDSVDEPKTG